MEKINEISKILRQEEIRKKISLIVEKLDDKQKQKYYWNCTYDYPFVIILIIFISNNIFF
jgi:hypothetical protein